MYSRVSDLDRSLTAGLTCSTAGGNVAADSDAMRVASAIEFSCTGVRRGRSTVLVDDSATRIACSGDVCGSAIVEALRLATL